MSDQVHPIHTNRPVVAAVSNPYTLKRKAPEISRRPLNSFLFNSNSATTDPFHNQQTSDSSKSNTYEVLLPSEAHTKSSFSESEKKGALGDQSVPLSTLTSSVVSGEGGGLPFWKRLPSLNLPFGSATIATVAECATEIMYKKCMDNDKLLWHQRSVRITGVVLHRDVNSDTSLVAILLGDPLANISSLTSPANKRTRENQINSSLAVSGERALSRIPPLRRSMPPTLPSTTTTPISAKVTFLAKKNTKLIYAPNKTPSTLGKRAILSSETDHSATESRASSSANKRPLVSSVSVKRDEDVLRRPLVGPSIASTSAIPTVWIFANPAHVTVENVQIGDLVMVMGEVQDRQCFEREICDEDIKGTVQKIFQNATQSNNLVTGWITARIIRNANGTDMPLYTKALLTRRRALNGSELLTTS